MDINKQTQKHNHQTKRRSTIFSRPVKQPTKETCNVGPAHQQYKPTTKTSKLVRNHVFGFYWFAMAYIPWLLSNKSHSFVALCRILCLCMCKHLLLGLSHDLHDSLGGESLLSIENMKRPKDSSASVLMVQLDIFFYLSLKSLITKNIFFWKPEEGRALNDLFINL